MNRVEKLALLTKILQGKATQNVKQQLRQSAGAGCVVIIYRHGVSNVMSDDEVSFYHKGQKVMMPYQDVQAFTRYEPLTLIMIPNNGREQAF